MMRYDLRLAAVLMVLGAVGLYTGCSDAEVLTSAAGNVQLRIVVEGSEEVSYETATLGFAQVLVRPQDPQAEEDLDCWPFLPCFRRANARPKPCETKASGLCTSRS